MVKDPSTLVFKLLAALGALSIVGMLILAAMTLRLIQQKYEAGLGAPSKLTGELGELGSSCGGTAALPCRPGLTCSSDPAIRDSEGVCVAEVQPQVSDTGKECDLKAPACEQDQYCKHAGFSNATGTCAQTESAAPKISSLELEGLSVGDSGAYHVTSGQKINVIVKTMNAISARLAWDLGGESGYFLEEIGDMKREPNGLFSKSILIKDFTGGDLVVFVSSKSGDTSAFSKHITVTK